MLIMNVETILLAENDQNLRQSIALILQRAGYHVTGVDCVERVEELLLSRVYDLLILDLDMAKSKQLLLSLGRNKFHGLPILILSGHSISRKEQDDAIPIANYLLKPVAPETLLEKVGKILHKDHAHPGKNSNYMNSLAV
jgi:DNA-binding response OmpR family regulator